MTLAGRTIQDLAAALAAGTTSSRALLDDALASIAKDPRAFTHVDADDARELADEADEARRAGRAPASLLAGIPISVKDLFDVAGEPTPAGSAILRDGPPAEDDAPVIARLRAAGAVIVGRTQMSEFAFSGIGMNPHYPPLPNPRDPARVPGGSSSGAAVSVVLGQAAMGLGSDTGGSVRIPAAFCGLVGFKPTQSRVTRQGVFPLSPSLDSIGPIANSVACCRIADALIADEPPEASPAVALKDLRVGVPADLVLDDMDVKVARAFDEALRKLGAAGVQVDQIALPELSQIPQATAKGTIANAEAFAEHRRLGLLEKRAGYDPNVIARVEVGGRMLAADYIDLLNWRTQLIREVTLRAADYDALVFPAVAIVPPRLADLEDPKAFSKANGLALRNAMVVNLLDRCAISLPMTQPGELPTGFMLVGNTMEDARLLAIAEAVEPLLRPK